MAGITSHDYLKARHSSVEEQGSIPAPKIRVMQKLKTLSPVEREKFEKGIVLLQRQVRCRQNRGLREHYQKEGVFCKKGPHSPLRFRIVSERQIEALLEQWHEDRDSLEAKGPIEQAWKIAHRDVVNDLQSSIEDRYLAPSFSGRYIAVYDERNDIQGIALFFPEEEQSDTIRLSDLCTAPKNLPLEGNQNRCRGVGSALIAEIIRVRRLLGGTGKMQLLAFEISKSFYSHLGFEEKIGEFYLSEGSALKLLKSYGTPPPHSILKDNVFWAMYPRRVSFKK